jgi:hypothetical protein
MCEALCFVRRGWQELEAVQGAYIDRRQRWSDADELNEELRAGLRHRSCDAGHHQVRTIRPSAMDANTAQLDFAIPD